MQLRYILCNLDLSFTICKESRSLDLEQQFLTQTDVKQRRLFWQAGCVWVPADVGVSRQRCPCGRSSRSCYSVAPSCAMLSPCPPVT